MHALNLNPKLKAIGICFGHQFLAKVKAIDVVTKTLIKGL
jgi:GMP synthase-like glutamine amidotransferase